MKAELLSEREERDGYVGAGARASEGRRRLDVVEMKPESPD